MPSNLIHFDLDGVLWDPHEFLKYTLPNCVNRGIEKGLKGEPRDILKELYEVRKEFGSNYNGHFDILVQRINGEHNPDIVDAMQSQYHACKADYMKPFPYVENVLKFCRNAGYILTVASNGNDEKQEDKLYDLSLMPYFEFATSDNASKKLFAIGEGDTAKPAPYTWTVLRNEVSEYFGNADVEVHVGDKLNADVLGANSLGIVSVYARLGPHGQETIDSGTKRH